MNITDLSSYFCDITGYVLLKRVIVASAVLLAGMYGFTPAILSYIGFSPYWTSLITWQSEVIAFYRLPINCLSFIKYAAGSGNDFNFHYIYTNHGTLQLVTHREFNGLKSAVLNNDLEAITKIYDNFLNCHLEFDPSLLHHCCWFVII